MKIPLALMLLCLLTACGVAYQGTSIREGVVDGTKIRVIKVTPETVILANSSPYRPKALPAAFQQGSDAGSGSNASPAVFARPRQATPVTRLPPPLPAEPYRIGVGDVVELSFREGSTPFRERSTVQTDGTISLPELGGLKVADLTPKEAEATLFARMVESGRAPAVGLNLAEFHARRVSIGGEVARPSELALDLIPLTLEAALARVGGAQPLDGATAQVRLSRRNQVYEWPLEQLRGHGLGAGVLLRNGDVLEVYSQFSPQEGERYLSQELRQREIGLGARAQARADLEVQRQGFERRLSVADALFEQGGVQARTGSPRQVYVLRGATDPREFGAMTAWHIDAGSAAGWLMMTRMELRPNDILHIAEQPVTRWSRVIDQISPSLISVPLNSAVRN